MALCFYKRSGPAAALRLGATTALLITMLLLGAAPTPVQAATTQLGPPLGPLQMGCGRTYCALVRTTGFQLTANGQANPFVAPRSGRIVAFTLKLATEPSPYDGGYFTWMGGGEPQAQIAILRPRPTNSPGTVPAYVLVRQSPPVQLTRHFGQIVTFPLRRSLLVRKGWTVALSTPTWAPVISTNVHPRRFSWRQARVPSCIYGGWNHGRWTHSPHTGVGTTRRYACIRKAALAYRATIKYRS